ncbi:hypothetical protein SAMD00019534_046710 [Acytostelium subglobosum LB1]|uniref:hypothetical protein n=1 Tax=Acytostelium subglobosum LB1 TaxID=1410327 RepID=UPI0006448485|nr:hypothetical protein SAMD00019534_046710 [Acytostelium subglobosum LB1]GAM21496.1 hypothetical protein SAMD00019534_046710 [Acytostelium subglobosum LB1]|eukprot:XP_012755615.1 hypothetical protein SAMD00019534_046710 [Acytostelium subglobosum LB1]
MSFNNNNNSSRRGGSGQENTPLRTNATSILSSSPALGGKRLPKRRGGQQQQQEDRQPLLLSDEYDQIESPSGGNSPQFNGAGAGAGGKVHHMSTVNQDYLAMLGTTERQVERRRKAAIDLKLNRRLLNKIIFWQSIGNMIRALPIFVLERYYIMLIILFQAIFLLIGSYGVKRLKRYLVLVYSLGCFSTTVADLVLTFTYAHVQNSLAFSQAQIAFWVYVVFVFILCTLNIVGGIVLGLKLFVSLHTLDDRSNSPLVLLAASLVGSFDQADDDEQQPMVNYTQAASRVLYFYGAHILHSLNVRESHAFNSFTNMLQDYRIKIASRTKSTPASSVPSSHSAGNNGSSNATMRIEYHKPVRFISNEVVTSKYNVITFFPKVIYFQFSRLANLYTLGIVMLCMFSFSPVGPMSSVTPLLVVIGVGCIKELIEDVKRHKQDKEINGRSCMVYRPAIGHNSRGSGSFETVTWRELKVGDLVYIKNDDLLPADIICLSTSRSDGRTYLETANLDGETNLKPKVNLTKTSWIRSAADLDGLMCRVECEQPTLDIYSFEGVLSYVRHGEATVPEQAPVSIESFLLRGTKVRNTEWVIGLVTYTGVDTKVERNSSQISHKRSAVEKGVNYKLILLFFLQTIICLICSIGANSWHLEDQDEVSAWYLGRAQRSFIYVSYVILYNTLIPLSMYVSMEVIRVANAVFINWDEKMYDPKTDTAAQARNTNINEELGQVQYLFSDKTGTLTCNEMRFNRCTIGSATYGPDESDLQRIGATHSATTESGQATYIREFLYNLSICNTVIVDSHCQDDDNATPKYQASSPDEEALTIAAASFGYVLKARDDRSIIVKVNGVDERYEILSILEFNSYRKRMSVIVRAPNGEIRLYCKGADSVIMERSKIRSLTPYKVVGEMLTDTETHIGEFASSGLRTLCMSVKVLSTEEYAEWSRKYQEASLSLVRRVELMDQAAELIEQDMCLIGATGIEDRLQDQVPETITSLREAGIKVWVLTGDKQETAISIATASSVINPGMELIILNERTKEDLLKRLLKLVAEKNLHNFNDSRRWGPSIFGKVAAALNLEPSDAPLILDRSESVQFQMAIVIDGTTLALALDNDLKYHFLQVAKTCESVVCCRCSPSQKAKVVRLVSERSFLFGDGAITLAIGDGANDVPMIQKAHVGVGISGREGMQAVLASDFAIANFHMLKRLLLVHGNRSYKRIIKLILYSFSKNVALCLSQFWFGFYSAFSGQMIYFDFLFTLFNALFTSAPILAVGNFDQDVKEEVLMNDPKQYHESQSNRPFSIWNFLWWIFLGLWQSAVIFYATFFILHTADASGGKTLGLWACGTAAYLYLVVTTNIQVSLITCYWTKWNVIMVVISVIGSILFVMLYCSLIWLEPEALGIIYELFTVPDFWLLYILVPAISLLPYGIFTVNKWIFSSQSDKYYKDKYSGIKLGNS